jgi:SAM-dependent methyltransferase
MSEARQSHWQRVYTDKRSTDVSWYQAVPEKSLELIHASGVGRDEPVLDAGGGDSTLVDHLLASAYSDISILDISGKALQRSRLRLGKAAESVVWIESDVTAFCPSRHYSLWHDRAVFHFLTDPSERAAYIDVVHEALGPAGQLILATFGPEGPERCSGLDIRRYDIDALRQLLGDRFELRSHELQVHTTPGGSSQQFLYSRWQKRHPPGS